MELSLLNSIRTLAQDLDGVFSITDLEVILNEKSGATFYRAINQLVSSAELIKVKRGLYATKSATLATLSNRIYPQSYISTGTVLAKNLLIGSVPARKIQAIKVGAPRIFRSPLGTIEFLSIAPKLYFGFERNNNANWATPEKAFLDVCYYFYKRKKFSFDPFSDIAVEDLKRATINQFLRKYDQRFQTYFKKNWPPIDNEGKNLS